MRARHDLGDFPTELFDTSLLVCDCVCALDTALHFCRGFVDDEDRVQLELWPVARAYLSRDFWLDSLGHLSLVRAAWGRQPSPSAGLTPTVSDVGQP
jgi:hypothetical protein